MIDWVTLSRALVASSNKQDLGARTIARAMSSRCFWPVERFPPPSPTSVYMPMGIARMSSSSPAMRAARQASSMRQEGGETHDIVEDVAGHELGMLEHRADLTPDLAWVEGRQLAAVVGDRARVGGLEAEKEPHQGRFSRARRADDRHELAWADLKADIVENLRPFLLAWDNET